jgi:RNA polymerase sigma-70 factor (ECF subfamily)
MNVAEPIELIQRAQAGDPAAGEAALSDLYERYRVSVYRYLYYRVGDEQAAEDLTSEVFLRMLHALPGYRPQSVTFKAWLFQIARNLAIDHYRKMGKDRMAELEEGLMDDSAPVEASVEQGLTHQMLRRALGKLSEEQRDVLILRFVTGMPIAEAARTLHKSEDAVKGLQRRALQALKEILSDWEVSYV